MTRKIKVGNLYIGGSSPITVQSMTNTDTSDVQATFSQLKRLEEAGCDIARLAVSDMREAELCKNYIGAFKMPLVADIQYDYRLAVACAQAGFDKIRFNPGNIGDSGKVRAVADACRENKCPIRIGVNQGSIKGGYTNAADALYSCAMEHIELLEKYNFKDIIISVKSSDAAVCIDAYKRLSSQTDYPLHIGITESGFGMRGIVRSSAGLGALLCQGIGDTLRVSLTGDPVQEVIIGKMLLEELGIRRDYCKIISCPTCSRCKYNLADIAQELEGLTKDIKKPLKIAVMGCAVNGPGEARDADFGVAGGGTDGKAALFVKGKVVKTVEKQQILAELMKMLEAYL